HLARGGHPVALERFDSAGLARAVRPQQAVDLAGVGGQRYAVDRGEGAVAHDEGGDLDGGHGGAGYFALPVIDVRRLRPELDEVKAALARKGVPAEDVQRAADLDERFREL